MKNLFDKEFPQEKEPPKDLSIEVNLVESRKELDVFIQIGSLPLVKVGSVSTSEGYSVEKLMRPVMEAAGRPSDVSKKDHKVYKRVGRRILEVSTSNLPLGKDTQVTSAVGDLYIKSGEQLLYNEGGSRDLQGKRIKPILVRTPFISRDKILKSIDVLYLRNANKINPVFVYKTFRPSESALAWLFWAEQQFLAFSNPQMSRINPDQIVVK